MKFGPQRDAPGTGAAPAARGQRSIGAVLPLTILLVLMLLTFWLDRTADLDTPRTTAPILHEPDYVVDKFVLKRLSNTGEARYVLSSARMVHFPDDDSSHLELPRLVQGQGATAEPNAGGRAGRGSGKAAGRGAETHVSAQRGVVSADGREVKLYGNVELLKTGAADPDADGARADDVRVRTAYLRVIPDDDKADTPERVVIEQGKAVLTGTGLAFDNRYRNMRLLSAVSGTFERKK